MKKIILVFLSFLLLSACVTTVPRKVVDDTSQWEEYFTERPEVKAFIDPYYLRPILRPVYPFEGPNMRVLYTNTVTFQDNPNVMLPEHIGFNVGYGVIVDTNGTISLDVSYFVPDINSNFEIQFKCNQPMLGNSSHAYYKEGKSFMKNDQVLFSGDPVARIFNYGMRGSLMAQKGNSLFVEDSNVLKKLDSINIDSFDFELLNIRTKKDSQNRTESTIKWYNDVAVTGYWVEDTVYEIDYQSENLMRIEYFSNRIEFYPAIKNNMSEGRKYTLIKIDDTYYFYNEKYVGAQYTFKNNILYVSELQSGPEAFEFHIIQ